MFFVTDFETHLFKPGLTLPRPVCASVSRFSSEDMASEIDTTLHLREDALDALEGALADVTITIVNHNLPFDLAIAAAERMEMLRAIMDALEAGRCRCTQTRQILIDISRGEAGTDDGVGAFRRRDDRAPYVVKTLYGLDDLVDWYFGEHLEKKDTWRLRYGELDGKPLKEWPEDAIEYPKKDTRQAFRVFLAQRKRASEIRSEPDYKGMWESEDGEIPDEIPQVCYAFALQLMQAHGLRTCPTNVAKFVKHHEEREKELYTVLGPVISGGLGLMREDGSMDKKATAAAIEEAHHVLGEVAPRTFPSSKFPNGQVKEDGETLTSIGKRVEGHADERIAKIGRALRLLGESKSDRTTANTWIPWLLAGTRGPVCPSYWPLVASGRLSARQPNVTNPPRKGAIRNAFRARSGFTYFAADFDTAEMRAHAQNCLELVGWSDLADALQRGEDPHIHLASELLGISYEEAWRRYEEGDDEVSDARQFCKIGNFGFMGGLGADGFVEYAAGYGYTITPADGKRLRDAWFRKWRENRKYFELINWVQASGGVLQQLPSKRVRGGLRYTDAANTMFQGRTADGAKAALWKVTRECFLGDWTYPPQNEEEQARKDRGELSPLYGSRPQILMHDEIIGETPDPADDPGKAGRSALRLAYVMRSAMQAVTPNIPAKASPVLMNYWYKGAKAVRDAAGNMRPSRPIEVKGDDGKTKTKWAVDEERMAA